MSDSGAPYHMRENPSDNVAPKGSKAEVPEGTTTIEIGSIQTSPAINYAAYKAIGKGLSSSARVTEDGRIVISLDMKKKLPDLPRDYANPVREYAIDKEDWHTAPPMSVVIMIVGSRGDVQPFIALGKKLKEHGHT
ncbi:hypothetical protein FRC09_011426, partial [Ceratobasidium sp. 395]